MFTHGLIIVAMKADNELSISVLLYFKSVKKWKYVLRKKQNQTKRPKKNSLPGVKPPTLDVQGQGVIYCATTTNFKQIILNISAHKILRWTLVELYLWGTEK